jgi:hypothetical protein
MKIDKMIQLYHVTWKCKSNLIPLQNNIKHTYWASSLSHCEIKKNEVQKDALYIVNSFTIKGHANVEMTKQSILYFINHSVLKLL